MKPQLTLTKEYKIKASKEDVWKGLTDPEIIKKYFFGTQADTDWKKGSPIYFRGSWEGKSYEDKGTILEVVPGSMVKYNYWSSMSGTEDIPENYANITYQLSEVNGVTTLTLTQDGIKSEESRDHSASNWDMVMDGLKKIVEGQPS